MADVDESPHRVVFELKLVIDLPRSALTRKLMLILKKIVATRVETSSFAGAI
jgi:hypothetical protein